MGLEFGLGVQVTPHKYKSPKRVGKFRVEVQRLLLISSFETITVT